MLILIMCGVLCGLDSPKKIAEYGKSKSGMLKTNFGIKGIPTVSVIYGILKMVDGDQLAEIIVKIMCDKLGRNGDIIAIDGKTICSTTTSDVVRELHILTALMTDNGVSLAQLATDDKSNEIPKMRELLALIDIEGKIITSDAMGCQKETCKQIIEQKGEYCIGLKGNQHQLHDDVKIYFETFRKDKSLFEIAQTSEKSRDRYEKRKCFLFKDIEWSEENGKWAGLKSILAIERQTTKKDVKSSETLFYISSLETTPENFLRIVREHWQIETLHWLLDVDFNEDKNRLRNENGLKSLNALYKFSISMHKSWKNQTKSKDSLKNQMFSCLLSDWKLLEILQSVTI
jgi:predicted transposase YbfD/YdcC